MLEVGFQCQALLDRRRLERRHPPPFVVGIVATAAADDGTESDGGTWVVNGDVVAL